MECRHLKTEAQDERNLSEVELRVLADPMDIKPNIKSEPEDEVETIEYTPESFQLDKIFTVKMEKIEPGDSDNQVDGAVNVIDLESSSRTHRYSIKKGEVAKQQKHWNSDGKMLSSSISNQKQKTAIQKACTKQSVLSETITLRACSECSYGTPSYLKVHMRKHTCKICQKRFARIDHLQSHLKVHVTKTSLNCSLCLEIFSTKTELLGHESTCKKRRYECYVCKAFSTIYNANLKRHMRVHSGVRPFECDHCSMKFKVKYNLKRHVETHTKPRPMKFRCSVCAQNFLKQSKRNAHEIKCNRHRYECYLCQSYMTYWKRDLQSNMGTRHTGERQFKRNKYNQ